MKKIYGVAAAFILGLSLVACGGEKPEDVAQEDRIVAETVEVQEETVEAKATPKTAKSSSVKKQSSDKKAKAEDYGRILFVGDSRTVDIFSAEANEIAEAHDGISVWGLNGGQYDDMVNYINNFGIDNFDTLVSWMGCNEFGNFGSYGAYYEQLMSQGKKVVVCTVGPTKDECLLDDMDWYYYPNSNQIKYNNSLVDWANGKGVKVIDLYTFISNSTTITVVPTDGIHYLPQPTSELWSEILRNLK